MTEMTPHAEALERAAKQACERMAQRIEYAKRIDRNGQSRTAALVDTGFWESLPEEVRDDWRDAIKAAGHIPATVLRFSYEIELGQAALDSGRAMLGGPPYDQITIVAGAHLIETMRRLSKELGVKYVEVPPEMLKTVHTWAMVCPDGKVWSSPT